MGGQFLVDNPVNRPDPSSVLEEAPCMGDDASIGIETRDPIPAAGIGFLELTGIPWTRNQAVIDEEGIGSSRARETTVSAAGFADAARVIPEKVARRFPALAGPPRHADS